MYFALYLLHSCILNLRSISYLPVTCIVSAVLGYTVLHPISLLQHDRCRVTSGCKAKCNSYSLALFVNLHVSSQLFSTYADCRWPCKCEIGTLDSYGGVSVQGGVVGYFEFDIVNITVIMRANPSVG